MVEIGINDILKKQKKSRYWLQKTTGISFQALASIVNNETKGIKFETLESICNALECTPNDIIKFKHDT